MNEQPYMRSEIKEYLRQLMISGRYMVPRDQSVDPGVVELLAAMNKELPEDVLTSKNPTLIADTISRLISEAKD